MPTGLSRTTSTGGPICPRVTLNLGVYQIAREGRNIFGQPAEPSDELNHFVRLPDSKYLGCSGSFARAGEPLDPETERLVISPLDKVLDHLEGGRAIRKSSKAHVEREALSELRLEVLWPLALHSTQGSEQGLPFPLRNLSGLFVPREPSPRDVANNGVKLDDTSGGCDEPVRSEHNSALLTDLARQLRTLTVEGYKTICRNDDLIACSDNGERSCADGGRPARQAEDNH